MKAAVRAAPTRCRATALAVFSKAFQRGSKRRPPEVAVGLTASDGFAGRPGMRKNYWVNELSRRKARHGLSPGGLG
jgi:hypothetical protein